MKRRLLKYAVTALALLVLGGYWAFSTFFFNPFEGEYQYQLPSLIPRDVDFFLTKLDLHDDFAPLPRPAFADDLEEDPHGRSLLEFETVTNILVTLDVEAVMGQLDDVLSRLPLDVDPLDLFGGDEVALGGYFRGAEPRDADWAVYGRTNWMGKLGIEALRSGLVNVEDQGITYTEIEHGFTLSGGVLQRPLHFTRLLDTIVASTTPELIAQAHRFDQGRGEDSFLLSAQFANHVSDIHADLEGDELHVYVDQRALLEALGLPGSWPDRSSPDPWTALSGRMFQIGAVRDLMATVSFGRGVTVRATGSLSAELMTPVQKRVYRERGFERQEVLEVARMAPADVGLFVYAHGPLNELLVELLDSMDDASVALLEDTVRNVWGYADAYPLLEDLGKTFEDRFAFFLRDNDYPKDPGENRPPADDAKVAAWTIAIPVDSEEGLEKLRLQIRKNPSAFGIRGRNPNLGGVFTNEVEGGGLVYEYHSVGIPGTGHLATLEMAGPNETKYFLVSNHNKMLGQVFVTYRRNKGMLAEDNWFQTLVNTGLASTDVLVWANPRAVAETTRAISSQDAALDIGLAINWDYERPRIEKLVLKEYFPGERYGAISPENRDAVELTVQQKVDEFEQDFTAAQLPRLRREYERFYDAAELMSGMLLQLSIDQKSFRLHGRVVVPFD